MVLFKKSPGRYLEQGNGYLLRHQYALALESFNMALQLNPNAPEAYYGRGLAYFSQGQFAEAVKDFDKAIQLAPPGAGPLPLPRHRADRTDAV